jgi:hypothetical protein
MMIQTSGHEYKSKDVLYTIYPYRIFLLLLALHILSLPLLTLHPTPSPTAFPSRPPQHNTTPHLPCTLPAPCAPSAVTARHGLGCYSRAAQNLLYRPTYLIPYTLAPHENVLEGWQIVGSFVRSGSRADLIPFPLRRQEIDRPTHAPLEGGTTACSVCSGTVLGSVPLVVSREGRRPPPDEGQKEEGGYGDRESRVCA